MITQWGFSEHLGNTAWEIPNSFRASEGTQESIDMEVEEITEKAYRACKDIIRKLGIGKKGCGGIVGRRND